MTKRNQSKPAAVSPMLTIARAHNTAHNSLLGVIHDLAKLNVIARLPEPGEGAAYYKYLAEWKSDAKKVAEYKGYLAQVVAETADKASVLRFEVVDPTAGTIRIVSEGGATLSATDALTMDYTTYTGKRDDAHKRRPEMQTTHRGLIHAMQERTSHAVGERWKTLLSTHSKVTKAIQEGGEIGAAGRGPGQTNAKRCSDFSEAMVKRIKAKDQSCDWAAVRQAMQWVAALIDAVEAKQPLPAAPKLTVKE